MSNCINDREGDIFLNCKNHAWGSSRTDPLGSHLADALDDHGWIVLNDGSKTRMDPRTGKEEVLDLVLCHPDVLRMNPHFSVGDCIGSDHLPLHCTLAYGEHHSEDPIFFRNVSQIDNARFKQLVNEKVRTLPETVNTARDLDSISGQLSDILKQAFHDSCPVMKKKKRNKPVSPLILALIKEKRKLRRTKTEANSVGDRATAQQLQQKMNKIGNEIKKEQKKEQKVRHNAACQRLCKENNPYKFFQSVKKLTTSDERTGPCTKVVSDELGNIAKTIEERIELFANRQICILHLLVS